MTAPIPPIAAATDKQVNYARVILKQEAILKTDLGHTDAMIPSDREAKIQKLASDKWAMSTEIDRAKRNIAKLKAAQSLTPPTTFKMGDRVLYNRTGRNQPGTVSAVHMEQGTHATYTVRFDSKGGGIIESVTASGDDLKPFVEGAHGKTLTPSAAKARTRRPVRGSLGEYAENDPKNRTFKLEDGVYMVKGAFTRIATSKSSGFQYATVWNVDTAEFDHVPGGIKDVRKFGRVCTVEEIENYARKHKVCLVCGRRIKTEASIKRGIGPVCAARVKARMIAEA
jgi:hypothetical protein